MDLDEALEALAVYTTLLVGQSAIVTNPFFNASEIRKFLLARREMHARFSEACLFLASYLEEISQTAIGTPLRSLAQLTHTQTKQAMALLTRIFRAVKVMPRQDIQDHRLHALWRATRMLVLLTDPEAQAEAKAKSYFNPSREFIEELEWVLKLRLVPPNLRTLFRKLKDLGSEGFSQEADPGAWFEMPPEQRVGLRFEMAQALEEQKGIYYRQITDPDEMHRAYQQAAAKILDVQARAGVNQTIILKEDEQPLEKILLKEQKLQLDGVSDYLISSFIAGTEDLRVRYPDQNRSMPQKEWGKIKTQLRKARTPETIRRVIQEAVDRKLFNKVFLEDIDNKIEKSKKNLVLKKGIPMTPLVWKPKSAEEFRTEHGVGEIRFDGDIPDETRAEILGRVSRAFQDLEMVYGKRFGGKHAKKLNLRFEAGEGVGGSARASYFAWGNSNRWQPEVRFGKDYAGLLAHELSHFMEDQIAYKIEKNIAGLPEYQYGDVAHGQGDIFGRTGVSLERSLENHTALIEAGKSKFFNAMGSNFPEIQEWMEAVLATPDYERWKDMVGSLDWTLPLAVERVTGKFDYDLVAKYEKIQLKSELPPDILEEAIKIFTKANEGDNRKLTYWHSSAEVWARSCEQYTYTKLALAGIANPWLTHLSYEVEDHPGFMDQERFETTIYPILERLFGKLKGKGVLSHRLRR